MVPSHLYCTTCGVANLTQAKFCSNCGQPLQASAVASTISTLTGFLTPNHLLKQHYRILRQIGLGGMGAVYKAADIHFSKRPTAIKEMSQSGLSQQELPKAIAAFKDEAD